MLVIRIWKSESAEERKLRIRAPWADRTRDLSHYQGSALPLSHMGNTTTNASPGHRLLERVKDRTLVISLEGFCSTIEPHLHLLPTTAASAEQPSNGTWWRRLDSNQRRRKPVCPLPPLGHPPGEPLIMVVVAVNLSIR